MKLMFCSLWPNHVKMIGKQLIGGYNISDHSNVDVTDEIKSDSLCCSKKDEIQKWGLGEGSNNKP